MQELAKLLQWMQQFLGSSAPMGDADEDDLIEQLLEFFGEFTLGELKFAVKMAAAGELEIKNTEHYDRFGGMYLEKLLAPYRALRNQLMAQYYKREIDRARKASEDISIDDKYAIIRTGVLYKWDEYKAKKFTYDYGSVTFRFLYNLGIIPKIEEGERKEQLKAKALERIKTAADYSKNQDEKKDLRLLVDEILKGDMSKSKRLFAEMMLIALNDFFETLSSTGVELSTLITEAEKKPKMKKLVQEKIAEHDEKTMNPKKKKTEEKTSAA